MNTDILEQNKALYRRFLQEVFNEGRVDRLDQFLSSNYIYHDAPPGTPPGASGVKQVVTNAHAAFPDLKITVEELVAEADKVCARVTTRGTQRGTFLGVPASGKAVTMPGLTMVRISDGRIMESWVKNDVMGLMKQIADHDAKTQPGDIP